MRCDDETHRHNKSPGGWTTAFATCVTKWERMDSSREDKNRSLSNMQQ